MNFLLAGLLALQGVTISAGAPQQPDTTSPKSAAEARRDSVRARRDSMRAERGRRPPKRLAVTAEHLASAFRTPAARTLLERVRAARMTADSTLVSYDAKGYARISAGLGFKKIGRDRLLFRHETAARVRWERGKGVWADITGRRTAVPMIKEARAEIESDNDIGGMVPIPYYPGSDALWVGNGLARREVDEREIVHPLAVGSEAYYTYAIGDSIIYRLPDGSEIRLVELRVSAREPRWNLVVGSFWFDAASAQLVRAAYRLSVPMDIVAVAAADGDDDIPRWLRPMTATIKGITVEYGLHKGRWWMPRLQAAEGEAQVSFMRVPFRYEESYRYASVNGT
ncbi:MAG TPA: hypothetical protein VFS05_05735, partial [Gemmatimonadaceae bacterium]|nr:hypothetical protein [Gemmatimonadaceae bacterium]